MIRIMARRMKGGIAMYRHVWVGLMIVTSIPGFLGVCAGERTYAATLPVYEVTQQGVTDEQLKKLSEAAEWEVPTIPNATDYVALTTEFQRNCDDLLKQAKARNIDGATLSYLKLTMTCVQCHKFVRFTGK